MKECAACTTSRWSAMRKCANSIDGAYASLCPRILKKWQNHPIDVGKMPNVAVVM